MVTEIWVNGSYRNIKPDQFVNSSRRMYSFCIYNSLPKLVYTQGGWCVLHDNHLVSVTRTLCGISFQELYNSLKQYKQ